MLIPKRRLVVAMLLGFVDVPQRPLQLLLEASPAFDLSLLFSTCHGPDTTIMVCVYVKRTFLLLYGCIINDLVESCFVFLFLGARFA